jgi:hypothetical protein
MAFTIPGRKPDRPEKENNTTANLKLASAGIDVISSLGKSLLSASSLRNRSYGYESNADLSRADARSAITVGQENAQIVNLERYRKKGEQLSYFAGSGFAAGSGSYAETLAFTDSEYAKTMATIHFESEAAKNALEFEARQLDIQSDYMRKVSKIQSRTAIITGIAGMVMTAGMAKINADDKKKED